MLQQRLWAGFALFICPLIIIAAIFNAGHLLGVVAYTSKPMVVPQLLSQLAIIAGGISSASVFNSQIKQMKNQ
ncbi:hypothetical protein [Neptunicella marina]|uniref:Uncharacterized protein n=1 Tax=Neptunicella marina TaxID=2125989 RepID=A0A8J6M0F1_9ALTE|nr:hypothetical protein [Neptunicella marina]MBC3767109.1 hypothetical protein [Neptunicella marina]